jgi:hypothetical protein
MARRPVHRVALFGSIALVACGARSELSDAPFPVDGLTCSDVALLARPGRPRALQVTLPSAAAREARWEVLGAPAEVTLRDVMGTTATFASSVEGRFRVRVTAPAGDGATVSCELTVVVRAEGPVASCPSELVTSPLRAVTLRGGAQSDRALLSTTWTLERAPPTSARPTPRPADRAVTSFTPDVAGDYTLRLRVVDSAGAADECTTLLRATPREGLRVELVWDPPGRSCPRNPGAACDRSDVDLHLLRDPGRGTRWRSDDECYYFNCNVSAGRRLSWGAPGPQDDPRLDIDDVDGHGPENINIDRPSSRAYRIGVHYFDAHGAGPQAATVLVYCGEATPAARFGPTTLLYRGTTEASDFWLVADVLPRAGGGCDVRPIDRAGMPWVLSYADILRGEEPPAP